MPDPAAVSSCLLLFPPSRLTAGRGAHTTCFPGKAEECLGSKMSERKVTSSPEEARQKEGSDAGNVSEYAFFWNLSPVP